MPFKIPAALKKERLNYILAISAVLFLISGMFVSRAMMSIGMITAGCLLLIPGNFKIAWNKFLKNKALIGITSVFFIYLISGLYSEDKAFFLERLNLKLPFLILPLAFCAFPAFKERHFNNIMYYFLLLTACFSLGSTFLFILNYQEISESYLSAKVLPTIVNHIRFSLMIAMAIFVGLYLFIQKHGFRFKWERHTIAAMTIFLFAFLHVLSVRSGLLAFYSATAILSLTYILSFKDIKKTTAVLAAVITLPLIMYSISPTLQNKIAYMKEDVGRFVKGKNVNDYSDGNRLLSWKIGIEIGNTNPLIGVGIGDVKNKTFDIYEQNYPEIENDNHLIPHNQFIFIYSGLGILGLAIFIIASFYPLVISRGKFLFAAINIIIISSYISEATIENQLGTCLYLSFFLLTWHYYQNKTSISCENDVNNLQSGKKAYQES
ncbi:MAG: O-antigen ligase family protein [Cytophagaceae bacterium]